MIVGGGSGMGAAAARKLAADGYSVAVLSSSGKGEALAKELGGLGFTGSNQSNDDLKRFVDLTMAKWGRIDALVNGAGHGPRRHGTRGIRPGVPGEGEGRGAAGAHGQGHPGPTRLTAKARGRSRGRPRRRRHCCHGNG